MAVNVTVTPEQAALLLPILQQVTSGTLAPAVLPPGQGDGSSTSSQSPSPSFVPPTRQLMWRHLSSPQQVRVIHPKAAETIPDISYCTGKRTLLRQRRRPIWR